MKSALGPVSVGIFGLLNVSALTAAYPTGAGCVGGVSDNPPRGGGVYPRLWYEVTKRDLSGLGESTEVSEIELRLHVFSQWQGMKEAQRIMAKAIELLTYQTPTVAGYQMPKAGRPFSEVPLPFEEINGVPVIELVSMWNLFAAEVAA